MATVRSDGYVSQVDVKSDGVEFKIDGVGVTATAAEINALADTGLSQAELDFLDGATAGTQVASKAVIADANVNTGIHKVTQLHLGVSGSETAMYAAKGRIPVATGANAVTDLAVGSNKMALVADSNASSGLAYKYVQSANMPEAWHLLTTVKAFTTNPQNAVSTMTLVDGQFRVFPVYLPIAATLTGVGWYQSTQGDTTADNENRIGLYTSDGTNLTLVASSTDSGTLWEGAVGWQEKAFTSTYAASAGLFWIGILANWSAVATSPVVNATANALAVVPPTGRMVAAAEHFCGTVAAQATLPATQAWSGVSTSGVTPTFYLY